MADTYWDLFFGYSVFWGIIASYVIYIARKQQGLARRLSELESRIAGD